MAHRDELIRQAVEKIQLVAPDLRVGVVQANRNEHEDAQVIVASIQTLSREHRIAPLVGTIATIIVDEAHHAAARTYLDALRTLGSFDPDGPLTVGVTATAGRADGVALGSAWQEIVYQRGILQMIVDGHLVDVRGMEVTTDLDYGTVSTSRGDFTDGSLGQAMEDSHAIEASAIAYQKYAADRSGVAFPPPSPPPKASPGTSTSAASPPSTCPGSPRDERAAILGRLHTGRRRSSPTRRC
ncbi:DEAD/DEAH box helicase family protein [Micromonospora sp. BRA006-A]|nr:DEAD/DEAH box helicase family protein [Micromonospora sp. BRA006-A]